MELREGLRSTGAVRRFTSEPVDEATLYGILDDARFAPSGGNRQPWRVAIVTDGMMRRELATLMQPVWNEYVAIGATGVTPYNVVEAVPAGVVPATPPHVDHELLEHIERVPLVLAVAVDLSLVALMDSGLHRPPVTAGASIYPFCWNLLLAARVRGLGGVITTFASRAEQVTGPLLGLPPDHALAATVFLGYPQHQPTVLSRHPVSAFATRNRFDGEPFDEP